MDERARKMMLHEYPLSDHEFTAFSGTLEYAREWARKNQVVVGVAEMALGAGLITWGVRNGVIDMGSQLVATQLGGPTTEAIVGAVGGAGLGVVAGAVLGSIGMTAMGGAIGIPAAVVIGGSAAIFGMAGYTIGDVSSYLLAPSFDIAAFAAKGSILLVGVALLVDGARRCINDAAVRSSLSSFEDRVIRLKETSAGIIATTKDELTGFIEEMGRLPEDLVDASLMTTTAALGGLGGAAAGGAIGAGSVTVLGSKALGAMAVSAGLVSAPVWPIIAGAAAGIGIGYAAYKAIKYWGGFNDRGLQE